MQNHEFIQLPGGQIINLNLVHHIEQVTRTTVVTVHPGETFQSTWIKIDGKLYEDPESIVFNYFNYKGSRPFSGFTPKVEDMPEYQGWSS